MNTLTGPWKIAADPENKGREQRWFEAVRPEAIEAPVPGIVQQVYPDYHGVAWYWCKLAADNGPRPDDTGVWQIHFHGGVDYLGEVWLNGEFLGSYEGGEGPFALDATAALRQGQENLLAVRVLGPTNEAIDGFILQEVPHRNKVIPFKPGSAFAYSGILLPVEVRRVPKVRIVDVFVRPDPHSGRVPVTVSLRNDTAESSSCHLSAVIGPATGLGRTVQHTAESPLTLPPGDSTHDLLLRVENPHLWSLDDPYLYRVGVRLRAIADDPEDDEYGVRCGFREFCVEDGFFRLNGKRIFVRSTHTGNHMPGGWAVPLNPNLVRRDLIMAKAAGFNMVRFITGMAFPEQLDLADEMGLLIYEECMASWCLRDSPQMAERFSRSTDAMLLRDRNHPSVVIWGVLNETRDGAVFRHAVDYLPRLRQLDPTRLVLLSSGRWDCQWHIGSVSNPGGTTWEHEWGAEAPDAEPIAWDGVWKTDGLPGGYFAGAGDAHLYPKTPQTERTDRFLRTLGHDTRPVFVSEYGIGSLMNVLRETRQFEQSGMPANLFDVSFVRSIADRLLADWQRWGFDGVYAFPEDMLWDSQRLHVRQRLLGFNLIRSNPQICGFNVTGMLDHAITGEGLWTFHREWKPGIAEALCDGFSPVRWCLFATPMHGYSGRAIQVEAVLANEDVLPPGSYPCTFRISGPQGVVWERRLDLELPEALPGADPPLAVAALSEDITLNATAGSYELAAYLEKGGAPDGGRLKFHLSDPGDLPSIRPTLTLWGIEQRVEEWLAARGAQTRPFAGPAPEQREVILVGIPPESEQTAERWIDLVSRMARGSTVVFLSPAAFARGEDPMGWLPLAIKGQCTRVHDWLYHKECVAKPHAILAGLPAKGIMDWDYYGPVIPHDLFSDQETPDEVVVASFYPCALNQEGYSSGIALGTYGFAAGRFTLNSLPILDELDRHPAADRILVNLVNDAADAAVGPMAALPGGFAGLLDDIGYTL